MRKRVDILLFLIIPCILMVLVGCSFEYRYKFLLSAYIYDPSGGAFPPNGSRLKPISIGSGNYTRDTLLDAAKDVPIIAKYTVGSSSPDDLENLIGNGIAIFQYLVGDSVSVTVNDTVEMVFLYRDGFGEAYFSIYFLVDGDFVGSIDDWGDPSSGGGGWSGGAT